MAFPVGWQRSCSLAIQHAQVNANQTAFPTLITEACLPSEMMTSGGANAAQSDGGDIRFSSDAAGATQLACEVVLWTQNANPALAKAEIWVPTSPLSASDVTIYVWYSAGGGLTQPAANAAFGSQAVWDTNFKAVWHLPDGSSLTANDSTAGANNASVQGTVTAAAGKIDGGATKANADGNYLDVANKAFLATGAGARSLFGWIKTSSSITSRAAYFGYGGPGNNSSFVLESGINSDGKIYFVGYGPGDVTGTAVVSDGNWHHIGATYDGTTVVVYVDGVANVSAARSLATTSTIGLVLGRQSYIDTNHWPWAGTMDEIRYSSTNRSASWIATEYNNQNSPSTFIIAGTPVSTLGGGGLLMMGCGS